MTIANSLAGLKRDTVAALGLLKVLKGEHYSIDSGRVWNLDWSWTVVYVSHMADVCRAVQLNET